MGGAGVSAYARRVRFWLGHSFWASLGLAALAATAAGFAGSWLERKRLARWRLNERELAKLTVP